MCQEVRNIFVLLNLKEIVFPLENILIFFPSNNVVAIK